LVFTLAYAAILLALRRQSTAWTGAIFGVTLWFVGPMLILPALLDLAASVRAGELTNPGLFMLALGWGWLPAAVDLTAHLVHGILSGAIYQHTTRATETAPCSGGAVDVAVNLRSHPAGRDTKT
jgi:hypothetical protein